MSAVPTVKCHFGSASVNSPGFAAAAAAAAAAANTNTTTSGGGGSAGATPLGNPSLQSTPTTNYFTNASSSYHSHFGDVSSTAAGAVSGGGGAGLLAARSPPTAAGMGVAGGTSSSCAAVSSFSVQAPIGTPNVDSGSVCPPATAAANSRLASSPALSSHGNSPHSTCMTPAVKFATPASGAVLSTTPKGSHSATSLLGSAMGGGGGGGSSSSQGSSSEREMSSGAMRRAASGREGSALLMALHPPSAVSRRAADAAAAPASALGGIGSWKAGTASGPNTLGSGDGGMNIFCAANSSGSTSGNGLLFAHDMNLTDDFPSHPAEAVETAASQAADEEVRSEAHRCAMLALGAPSNASEGTTGAAAAGVAREAAARGMAAPSPTSPVGSAHSSTASPTSAAPRHDGLQGSPRPSAKLNVRPPTPTQGMHAGTGAAATTPRTPLSSRGSGSRHGSPVVREPVVSVYDSDFKSLLSVPASQVVHRPHPSLGVSRLVLCRNYSPEHPGACGKGELCKFVHANVSGAARCSIHVNYAWRSLTLCAYPRLPPGEELTVLAPNERPPAEVIASERILVTRGSTNRHDHTAPLSHCAHYYFNRMCNRGERCNFIHAVHVDPTVQGDFKRAPAPTAVAPIVSKSPTSPALRTVHGYESTSGSGGAAGGAGGRANAAARSSPPSAVRSGAASTSAVPPPPPPPPPPPGAASYGFMACPYGSQPPHGAVAYPLAGSPNTGGGPYMLFSSSAAAAAAAGGGGGGAGAAGFLPTTLVPPPPSHLGNSNGVYLLVPAHPTASVAGTGTPRSPVSPLGQSLGSLSGGPVDWSFYGDLETSAWMPSSPSTRF